jgi:hypothetical protein
VRWLIVGVSKDFKGSILNICKELKENIFLMQEHKWRVQAEKCKLQKQPNGNSRNRNYDNEFFKCQMNVTKDCKWPKKVLFCLFPVWF